MAYELKRQSSGAFALHHRDSKETMHPGLGPWEEANRLYVASSGLAGLLEKSGGGTAAEGEVVLFDVGLGAAANALAAIACHEELRQRGVAVRPLRLVSFEHDLEPLRFALAHASQLGYLLGQDQPLGALIDEGRWEGEGVEWELRLGDFTRLIEEEPRRADVVFFDPFSPRTNPAMWSLRSLESLYRCRKPGGDMRLITYSTAFGTRCGLLLAGFYVGELGEPGGGGGGVAGGIAGKKVAGGRGTEAAAYFSTLSRPLQPRWLQRWRHDREPWPCLTPQKEYRRLREALAEHPQWGQPGDGESGPEPFDETPRPRQNQAFRRRRRKPIARPPR